MPDVPALEFLRSVESTMKSLIDKGIRSEEARLGY
jgi:hypothetical protein